jgi:hypothetical protein
MASGLKSGSRSHSSTALNDDSKPNKNFDIFRKNNFYLEYDFYHNLIKYLKMYQHHQSLI